MAKVCAVTGAKPSVGHNVSHSNRKTKRRFLPNLFKKKFLDPVTGKSFTVRVSARGLKSLTKNPSFLKALVEASRK